MKTFSELNAKLGGNETQTDWKQHENGGGWINKPVADYAPMWAEVSALIAKAEGSK